MNKTITYFSTGVSIEEIEYSDEDLITLIKKLSKRIDGFNSISMWFMQKDELNGCIAIDIGTEEIKLGNHMTLNVYDFNLLEENFSNYVTEAQRIKGMLKRNFPEIKVTSNFH
jgi:hypothetical protein